MKRLFLYVVTLAIAAVVIVATLQSGASLPSNAAATEAAGSASAAGSAASVQPTGPTASAGSAGGWFGSLAHNLDHPLSRLFIQLLAIIVASRAVGHAFVRIGLPAVVGEMAAGILLGPSLLGAVSPSAFAFIFPADSLGSLRLLSQIGICLFMFAVGMELDASHVRGRARSAVAVSHASILFPFTFGVAFAMLVYPQLGGANATFTGFALFMGISMSVTAFPVLARILQERGMTGTMLGSIALLCAAVGDVSAWTILAFVVAIARSDTINGAILSLVLAIVFIVSMIWIVRPALARWLGQQQLIREEPSNGTLAVVICVMVASALATETIGIHAMFGAFLAGVAMPSAIGFRTTVRAHVEKFSSVLLLPLFFAFTGLRTQLGLLDGIGDWMICAAIIAIATVGKLGASAIAARISGMSWSESLQLGALMNTRGLMELIVLNIGYDLGILSPRIFTMLVIMAMVTTMMTGPLLTLFGARPAVAGAGVTK